MNLVFIVGLPRSGYFLFNMMRDFSQLRIATAYEADLVALVLLKKIKGCFCLDELAVHSAATDRTEFEYHDVILFLNSHMWLHKRFGRAACNLILKRLIRSCRAMYFQTCGADGAGMYRVPELRCAADVANMLTEVGGRNVTLLETSDRHDGGNRHMFRLDGCGRTGDG